MLDFILLYISTFFDVILEVEMRPYLIVNRFGRPGWPSWLFFGGLEKITELQDLRNTPLVPEVTVTVFLNRLPKSIF